MLRLPSFEYETPHTLDEAAGMLARAGPDAALMSGGTDLLPRMKRRQRTPAVVIGLRGLRELREIRVTAEGDLRIGAGCALAEVAGAAAVRARYPALAQALACIASPTIRQMGTLGGNLCLETRCRCFDLPAHTREALGHCLKDGGPICLIAPRSPRCWAVAASDAAPVLIALGARVRLVTAREARVLPLEAMYRDDGLRSLTLEAGEILAEILLPPPDGVRATYYKARVRGAIDFAAAGVAVAVRRDPGGTVAGARIVLGAVASAPVVAEAAARVLIGRRMDAQVVREAATAAGRAVKPLENADLSAAWRKQMVAVATVRALRSVA